MESLLLDSSAPDNAVMEEKFDALENCVKHIENTKNRSVLVSCKVVSIVRSYHVFLI